MADYKMKYKCRICGEEFYEGVTSNENIAFSTLVQIAAGKEIVNNTGVKFIHIKKDHYGIADLIGCDIIGGEEK